MNWIEYEISHMPPLEQQVIRLALVGMKCTDIGFLLCISEKDLRATINALRKRLTLPLLTFQSINGGRFAQVHGAKPLRDIYNPEWAPLPPIPGFPKPTPTMDDPAF